MSHISIDQCACASPDGGRLFSGLSTSISNETVGLVGRNGCGKTTLLDCIAGCRQPASGSISCDGTIGMMVQVSRPDQTIAEALGLVEQFAIHDRIEAGEMREGDLDEVDWTLPDRVQRSAAMLGLAEFDFNRSIASLSGGERTRLRLVGALLGEPDVLLLDEPTNDLDRAGRKAVANLLAGWGGPAVVASHDRDLLEQCDRIIELSPAGCVSVAGGWSTFVAQRDAEREQAQAALVSAEREVAAARRGQQARIERQAQRTSQGKGASARRGDSRLEINARKEQAAKSTARSRGIGEEQVSDAKADLEAARARVERLVPVRIELPRSGLLPGHVLVELKAVRLGFGARQLFGPLDLMIRGPERIALVGPNGSGKTSLIRIITGHTEPSAGEVRAEHAQIVVLDQHLSLLNPEETALAAMRWHNPALDRNAAYAALAAYGFRSLWADRLVASLSGGEKVRLALACLFSRPDPPHLLILDEPTNHLDIEATELLEQALMGYDGALLCVSHDEAFRNRIGLTREISLVAAGQ